MSFFQKCNETKRGNELMQDIIDVFIVKLNFFWKTVTLFLWYCIAKKWNNCKYIVIGRCIFWDRLDIRLVSSDREKFSLSNYVLGFSRKNGCDHEIIKILWSIQSAQIIYSEIIIETAWLKVLIEFVDFLIKSRFSFINRLESATELDSLYLRSFIKCITFLEDTFFC
jgi:hypothetical protein